MLEVILLVLAVVAIGIGASAASRGLSPWWLFLVACVFATPMLVQAEIEIARVCGDPSPRYLPFWFTAACLCVTVILFGAAAVDGLVDGVRRRGEVEAGGWFLSAIVCPVLSGGAVLFVFYAVLAAALHCD